MSNQVRARPGGTNKPKVGPTLSLAWVPPGTKAGIPHRHPRSVDADV